jgi:hypothetical protein
MLQTKNGIKVPISFLTFFFLFSTNLSYGAEKDDSRSNSLINQIKLEPHNSVQIPPQPDEYYQRDYLRYGDFVYHNNINSVLFNRKGWEFSPSIIELNTDEKLVLQFDDLDADFKNYSYTIIHCDALWSPSNLVEYEFIEGFYQDLIDSYSFSRNTRVPFTHYTLEFPNANMKPLVSGNYILKVFVDGDPDNVALTRKFMVFEQRLAIEATIKQATNLYYRDTKQELDFIINTSLYPISNPYQDLKVVITQNGRWDNAIFNLKPRLVQGNQLIYDYEDGNLFPGGNEFRNFDTRSLRYRSLRVREINSTSHGWDVFLYPDRNRRFLRYTTDPDINGRYLIKTDDYNDDILESDYTWVYFSLPHPEPMVNGNIYILGGLTDWNFTAENRMEYNYQDSQYEQRLLLKQGYYNYQYAFLEDGKDKADVSLFEGSHSIAENDYTILVYYRKPGDLFESLVGIRHINSGI